MSTERVDPQPDFLAPDFVRDPYPTLAALRERAAAVFDPSWQGWWALRDAEMTDLLRSPRFAKSPAKALDGPYTRVLGGGGHSSMLFMDDPDHARVRGLVSRAFTKKAVEERAGDVQRVADELLDAVAPDQPFDLIAAFASPLPIIVIAEMLGIEPDRRADFKRWSDDGALSFDPFLGPDQAERVRRSAEDLRAYLGSVVEQRRAQPQSDLTSALVTAQAADGDRLSETELVDVLGLLLAAGNITTTDLIGNGIAAFLRHPEQWNLLCRDPTLAEAAVEEVLRFDSSVVMTERIALADETIGGCPVSARQWVWAILASANRDPSLHPDPDRFDIERADDTHHSFGGGPHLCLGAPLARLEAKVAFSTLARRFPDLHVAERTARLDYKLAPGFRGLNALWVEA